MGIPRPEGLGAESRAGEVQGEKVMEHVYDRAFPYFCRTHMRPMTECEKAERKCPYCSDKDAELKRLRDAVNELEERNSALHALLDVLNSTFRAGEGKSEAQT